MLLFRIPNTLAVNSQVASSPDFDNEEINSFLKLLFIESGAGCCYLNQKKCNYKSRDILLIPAYSDYIFEEEQKTHLSAYNFLDPFSAENKLTDCLTYFKHIDLNHQNLQVFDPQKEHTQADYTLTWNMYEKVKEEYQKKHVLHEDLITAMISVCLRLVARNIITTGKGFGKDEEGAFVNNLINYIDSNLHEPSRLRVASLAQTFNTTKNALSHFFKKKSGKSIYHYVLMNRMTQAKIQLKETNFTVAQIANQLGFTDESHLTRMFKKYFNTTPREYREAS